MKAFEIVQRLQNNGFESYYIGGCVRDMLLNLPVKDIDIVTNARPDQIIQLFSDVNIAEVGKSFGVVLVDGIEVATYRGDRYNGLNDKDVTITFVDTLREDVSRRDFTINTFAYDPIKNEVIDLLNGIYDLKRGLIRFVGNPVDRINDDPNRILRAFRFATKLNFDFDDETHSALSKYGHYVNDYVTKERVRKEIMSVMTIKNASRFFMFLHEYDILKDLFPSMESCYNHEHGKYHIEDVFEHLMLTGDHISTKYPLLKLAGYLHDVGKPSSFKDGHFIEHENIGADLVRQELKELKFSKDEIDYVSKLVLLHMNAHLPKPTDKGVRRYLAKLDKYEISYKDMARLVNADIVGSYRINTTESDTRFQKLYKQFKLIDYELNRPEPVHKLSHLALNGNDVMRILNIKPSKQVGDVLDYLYQIVLDEPEKNNVDLLTSLVKTYNK